MIIIIKLFIILERTCCFQLFQYYIKDYTYKYISAYENGYFISNNITGIISKCHSIRKTCSQKYIETSTNCDSCNNEQYYLETGNCILSCFNKILFR